MLSITPSHWPYLPKLLLTVAFLRLIALDRQALAAPCFALFLVSMLMMQSFTSPWLSVGWIALFSGFLISPKSIGPRPVYAALIYLLIFHALAIPGSIFWGSGNWELTAGVLLWMAPALLLYFADIHVRSVFNWLLPAVLFHAGLVIYQGWAHWYWFDQFLIRTDAPTGLANNGNLAAGFLVLGLIHISTSKSYSWLSAPVLVALLFTGSRWGLIVGVVALVAILVSQRRSWRVLAAVLVALGTIIIAVIASPFSYGISGLDSLLASVRGVNGEIATRLAVPHIPSFLPSGVAEHPGLHNVPLRIAIESGVLAAGLWVGVTAWTLLRGRGGTAWWMLLALVSLSMLDYYSWMGHLGGFWWMLVGVLSKGKERT